MLIKRISIGTIEHLAHRLAVETMSWNEPIPKFETRYPKVLESCINAPFQKFNRKDLYKGLVDKAAILFYLMIKNHPFQNGNKRLAMTTLFVFLYLNKKWLQVDKTELYNFAIWLAGSPPKFKDELIKIIRKFIQAYLVDYEN